MCIGGFAIRKIKTQQTINIKTVISVYRNYIKIKKFGSMFHTNSYIRQQQLTPIVYVRQFPKIVMLQIYSSVVLHVPFFN